MGSIAKPQNIGEIWFLKFFENNKILNFLEDVKLNVECFQMLFMAIFS